MLRWLFFLLSFAAACDSTSKPIRPTSASPTAPIASASPAASAASAASPEPMVTTTAEASPAPASSLASEETPLVAPPSGFESIPREHVRRILGAAAHGRSLRNCYQKELPPHCMNAAKIGWMRENIDWELFSVLLTIWASKGAAEPAQRNLGTEGLINLAEAASDRTIRIYAEYYAPDAGEDVRRLRPANEKLQKIALEKLEMLPPKAFPAKFKKRAEPILARARAFRHFYTLNDSTRFVIAVADGDTKTLLWIGLN